MRCRRVLLKLVNRVGCLKRAHQRLSRQRAPATWEYKEHGWWRSLEPEHAKRVEAAYVAGYRDVCCHDPKNPSWEHGCDFEYMDLTLITGGEKEGALLGDPTGQDLRLWTS